MSKIFKVFSTTLLVFFSIQFAIADGMRREEDSTMNVVDHDDPLAVTETVIERHKGPPPSNNTPSNNTPSNNTNTGNNNSRF